MNAVEVMFTGSAGGAVAAAEETSAAIKSVGTTSAVSSGEIGKLERGALAGSGALSGMGRSVAFASAAFVGAAGLVGAVKGAVDESEKLAKATDSARAALQHAGENADQLIPKYQATAKAAAQYGVSEATAMTGLARATLLTGSAVKAQRAYEQALLISKATGKDFNSVLTATSKAQDGSATSLTRYGIMLPKVTTAQDALKAANAHATAAQIAHAKAVDANSQALQTSRVIMQRFGGQAEANTSNMDKLRANVANLGATLGGPLVAGLNLAAGGLSTLLGWIQKNKAILEPIAEVIGIVTAAWLAYLAVTEGIPAAIAAVEGAMVALDAVMVANPIGIVVVAIAALVAAFIVAWQHSQTFRDIVLGTWHAIQSAAEAVFGAIARVVIAAWDRIRGPTTAILDFLRSHWRAAIVALAAILLGPLGAIVALIVTHWSQVRSVTVSVWNAVRSAVSNAVHDVRSVVSTVFGAIAGIVKGAASGVRSGVSALVGAFHPVLSVLEQIIHLAETAFGWLAKIAHKAGGVLSHVPGAGILSHIPGFATGVTDFAGGLAVVGEHGPEIVSLPHGADVFSNLASSRLLASGSARAPAAAAGPTYNIYVTSLATTGRGVAQELAKIVRSAPRSPAVTVVAR